MFLLLNITGANTFNACGIPLTIGKKDYDEKRQIVSLIGNPPDENGKFIHSKMFCLMLRAVILIFAFILFM